MPTADPLLVTAQVLQERTAHAAATDGKVNTPLALLSDETGPFLQTRIRLGHYQSRLFDWRYRVDTCGQQSVSQLGITGQRAVEVHGFSSSSIGIVRAILARLPIQHKEWVFTDLGSGKGRTLLLASAYPFKRVVGVEHAYSLVDISRKNLRNFIGRRSCFDSTIVVGDVLDYLPPADENLLVYMFNPFSAQLIARCVDRLANAPLAADKRRMLCFVQQRTHLAKRVDIGQLSKAVVPVALDPLPFDWFSYPQLEVSLFDVRATF